MVPHVQVNWRLSNNLMQAAALSSSRIRLQAQHAIHAPQCRYCCESKNTLDDLGFSMACPEPMTEARPLQKLKNVARQVSVRAGADGACGLFSSASTSHANAEHAKRDKQVTLAAPDHTSAVSILAVHVALWCVFYISIFKKHRKGKGRLLRCQHQEAKMPEAKLPAVCQVSQKKARSFLMLS